MKYWQCSVCRYIHEGDEPPEKCPVCGVDSSKFVEISEADLPESKRKKSAPKESSPAAEPESREKESVPAAEALKESESSSGLLNIVEALLVKYHAHPVSVHTPNGVLPMAVVLYILAWLFNSDLLAKTAMVSQIFVVLSLPFVIYTGTVEWRKKYNAAMTSIFKIKIVAAAMTAATCIITLAWYLIDPQLLSSGKATVFILINLLMLACAGTAGHIGGKLVFKD